MNNDLITNADNMKLFTSLGSCKKFSEFKETIHKTVIGIGFSDFTFSALAGKSSKLLTTFPKELYSAYQGGSFVEFDLMLEHSEVSTEPVFYSDLDNYIALSPFESAWQKKNREIFDLYTHYGYYDCYCIPQRLQVSETKAVFLLADRHCSREEFRHKIEKNKSLILMLADAVAFFSLDKFPESILCDAFDGEVKITPKPLKLLNLVAQEGLMLKEASDKLCISLDTANKHISVAKQALGATTLANAVYLAVKHGLIGEKKDNG